MGEETEVGWERNFRQRLRQMRENLGWSQTQLAALLNKHHGLPFHQPTIARIESGARPIRLDEAIVIAQAMGSTLDGMVVDFLDPESMQILLGDSINQLARLGAEMAMTLKVGPMKDFDAVFRRASTAWNLFTEAVAAEGREVDTDLAAKMDQVRKVWSDGNDAILDLLKLRDA